MHTNKTVRCCMHYTLLFILSRIGSDWIEMNWIESGILLTLVLLCARTIHIHIHTYIYARSRSVSTMIKSYYLALGLLYIICVLILVFIRRTSGSNRNRTHTRHSIAYNINDKSLRVFDFDLFLWLCCCCFLILFYLFIVFFSVLIYATEIWYNNESTILVCSLFGIYVCVCGTCMFYYITKCIMWLSYVE